jgi:hypothetical protein
MKEGAYLILTVPAFQFLWGRHDTDHHHKRRYDASSLRGALRAAGLEIEHMSYFNSLLFPIIATVRLLEKMWPGRGRGDDLALPGAFVNRLLEAPEARNVAAAAPGRPVSEMMLSVVVPAYNEEEVLPEFHRRITNVLAVLGMRTEVVYVNDGSTDDTMRVMMDLHLRHPNTAVVDLSRNFGKEIALTAGLDNARGDAIVVIDADLQDPPELIPQMVE